MKTPFPRLYDKMVSGVSPIMLKSNQRWAGDIVNNALLNLFLMNLPSVQFGISNWEPRSGFQICLDGICLDGDP